MAAGPSSAPAFRHLDWTKATARRIHSCCTRGIWFHRVETVCQDLALLPVTSKRAARPGGLRFRLAFVALRLTRAPVPWYMGGVKQTANVRLAARALAERVKLKC